MFTEDFINELITEGKKITEPPKKEFRLENQHRRNEFQLSSLDGKRKFTVFIRQHNKFIENFSIGLIYHSEEGSINLFRCNGNHGEIVVDILDPVPHYGYHTHKITAELLDNNVNEPRKVELTNEYASFEQALAYFCRYVNIKDCSNYFPFINQPKLFQ